MGGNLGFGTMNEISSLMAAGIITPVVTIDRREAFLLDVKWETGKIS
jgi:hypothetical protein